MPEPVTPSAPTTPPSDIPSSSVAPGGSAEAADQIFSVSDQTGVEPAPGTENPGTPASPQEPQTTQTPEPGTTTATPVTPKDPALVENPETTTTPETPTTPVEPVLLAGKYKTEAELRAGFSSLGGDPSKYTDVKTLEEAYGVRNAEYTRVKQEQAEFARINTPPAPESTPEALTTKIINEIDWSKLPEDANAKDLMSLMIPAIVKNLPQNTPKTPEQIASEVQPLLERNTKVIKEIAEVEADVPRLRLEKDATGSIIKNPFRDAFAVFVGAQRANGTYQNLKASMKDFIGISESVVKDKVAQQTVSTAGKVAATPPGENGQGLPAKPSDAEDILTGIIESHNEYKGKFNFK